MVRAPCCEKMGLKKGPWSSQEDHILISYIQRHGHGNWRALPKHAGNYSIICQLISHALISNQEKKLYIAELMRTNLVFKLEFVILVALGI